MNFRQEGGSGWGAGGSEPQPTPCPRCVDVEWLALSGEALEQIAARMHSTPQGLVRHLQRHGRGDLIRGTQRLHH